MPKLAIMIAKKLGSEGDAEGAPQRYKDAAKDMLAAIKDDDADTLASILEAVCAPQDED